jgi:hypothetical protein
MHVATTILTRKSVGYLGRQVYTSLVGITASKCMYCNSELQNPTNETPRLDPNIIFGADLTNSRRLRAVALAALCQRGIPT